jgi:hypothetical protein
LIPEERKMDTKFEEWAIMEIFGYRKLAGKVSDAVIGGGSFIRIDIPGPDESWSTQFYSPQAVYSIIPVGEDLARGMAEQYQPEPVHRWELPQLRQPDIKPDDIPDTFEDFEHDMQQDN